MARTPHQYLHENIGLAAYETVCVSPGRRKKEAMIIQSYSDPAE